MRRTLTSLLLLASTLFGTAALAASSLTVLHHFDPANPADTFRPDHGIIRASDGLFYGPAWEDPETERRGSLFRMDEAGNVTVLHRFSGPDGKFPADRLVEGPDGALYGTTGTGGIHPGEWEVGAGTIFKMTKSGALTTLHHFNGRDGERPRGGLTRGADGNFYGVTHTGGGTPEEPTIGGTVFRITPEGVFTRLHSFTFDDGADPMGPLLAASDGNLYGTTEEGGEFASGTVYRITPTGELTVLYSFSGRPNPNGGLVEGPDGLLYGTTEEGGMWRVGTIYRISKQGEYERLHSFDSQASEGARPRTGLTLGLDGNLYGVCPLGGLPVTARQNPPRAGTIYRYNRTGPNAGEVDVLHTFGLNEARAPRTVLFQTAATAMYGVSWAGGTHDWGTAFRFNPEEPVPVRAVELTDAPVRVGKAAVGRVVLAQRAGRGGTRVSLASVSSSAAVVPSTVTVPQGRDSATFRIRTRPVIDGPVLARISASVGGAGTSSLLNVVPVPGAEPPVRAVEVGQSPIQGGSSTGGQVFLTRAARAGGVTVNLKSSNPAVLQVPATVTVGEGFIGASFPITTTAVQSATTVRISAGNRRLRAVEVRVEP